MLLFIIISSAFNGMNSMASFNSMGHPGHHSGLSAAGAKTPVTPTSSMPPMTHVAASVPPSSVAGPCGGLQQQPARNLHHHVPPNHVHSTSDGYACMSRTPSAGYDISSLSQYNRHHHGHPGAMGPAGVTSLGHQPMGPTATSVAMANATHNYHQSVNGQYAMHHNSHNTGITIEKLISHFYKQSILNVFVFFPI